MEFSGIVRCKSSNLLATITFCNLKVLQIPQMMAIQFDAVYLAGCDGQLASEWLSCVEFERCFEKEVRAVILPPMRPDVLKVSIEVRDSLGRVFLEPLVEQMASCLRNGLAFWEEQLLYDTQVSTNKSSIELALKCKVWNSDKVSTLLQKPVERRSHMKSLPQVQFLKQLKVVATLCCPCDTLLSTEAVIPQFNEFLGSLFVSQLEFRYPFVFSSATRTKFLAQESSIGPISYALASSSALLPLLTKLIEDDTTATTAYRLVSPNKKRPKNISFQIAKQKYQ